ncbi:uncharacterized protein LOC130447692 isoform X2 [Diorhabda sublineata]|uniref:uncharacterized protein LOC130447692 isoform X2 n=1 Tax=Diorhabda sublineata TaxID=1163346 RepID=UPI0024E0A4CC|nr:uncharacterized protein LOC130447692 isoform X2 [Diorhabda sublineata]
MDHQNIKKEMDIHNVKEEVDVYDDFQSNIDIKQEVIGETSPLKIENINVQINGIYSIKKEINDDFYTTKIFDKNLDVINKTKRNIPDTTKIKLAYLKVGKRTKSKVAGSIRNGKYIQPNAMGLMICVYCGKLYTKQVELTRHSTMNHFKQNKFCRVKIHHKIKNRMMKNVDVKDEVEVVEHKLKMELQDMKNQLDITDKSNKHRKRRKCRQHKMSKFDKEKDELLIESVQCYCALYNKSDKEYKNNIYKHKCWEKISEIVGLPVSECKKRWKSLRDQYNKKTKESSGTGSAKLNNTWEYMKLMSFLSNAPGRRRSKATGYTVNDSQTNTGNKGVDSECNNTPNTEVNTGSDSECEVHVESRDTSFGNIGDTDTPSRGPTISKKRKPSKLQETIDKRESQRLNLLEALVHNTQKQSQVRPQSAIKKFFESMADVVENFPPREQAIIRAKVCQLISDTEIKLSSAVTPRPIISTEGQQNNLIFDF